MILYTYVDIYVNNLKNPVPSKAFRYHLKSVETEVYYKTWKCIFNQMYQSIIQ